MNSKPIRVIAAVAMSLVLSAAFVLWRLQAESAPPVRVRILSDPSGSQQRNCFIEGGLAEKGFHVIGGVAGSSIRVFMIGGPATANEPLRLNLKAPRIGPSAVLADRSGVETELKTYIAHLREACEKFQPTKVSPIYLGLKRMVEEATDQDPSGRFKGYVFAHSDLQETEVPAIKRALRQRAGSPLLGFPKSIDNAKVDVFVCGYSETIGVSHGRVLTATRQPDSSDRLIEVWKQLFTRPSGLRIEAYCDGGQSSRSAPSGGWTKPKPKDSR